MWASEAQDARRDREIEAMKGNTEGLRAGTEDVEREKHEGCLFHCSAEASKTRKECACIFLPEKRAAGMSPVGCVEVPIGDIMRVIEPITHAFGSNGAEDDNVAEREDRGRGGEERRRGGRAANAKRGIGPDRAPDLKLSENVEGWDTSAQTKQKIRTVKKVNGKVCWIIQRSDRSKGQKERSKDGKGKIA